MTKILILAGTVLLGLVATTFADEPHRAAGEEKEATKAMFLITGLHCPPCTRTVESSLSDVKGIRSIKVDWRTKNARVEFDEAVLPAQKVAQLIAATPHMMGSNMHYGGWLGLKVPALKDDATVKQVKEVLSKVKGVKQVATYPTKHSVGVAFAAKGDLTSAQLIEALTKAGIKAENL
ncbi:MAG: cation transporter [Planctomycetes bacterium]|nr:cation transporter [Planctomycetota bacterium]